MKPFAIAAGLFLICACASQPITHYGPLKLSDFLVDQKTRWEKFKSFSGKANVDLKGASGTGKIQCELLKGRLWFGLVDPLGRPQFSVVLVGREFLAIYSQSRRALKDDTAGRAFLGRNGIFSDFHELSALSVGAIPREWRIDQRSWVRDRESHSLFATTQNGQVRIDVSPEHRGVLSVVREDQRAQLSEFEVVQGLTVAMKMRVTSRAAELTLEWEDGPTPDEAVTSHAFSPESPDGFQVEYLH